MVGRSLAGFLLAPFLVALMAGCAGWPEADCPYGGRRTLVAEMLFGRNVGDRVGVSDVQFRRFVDEELTPRFPDGLTVVDATGQYRDAASDHIVREPSKVVLIALPEAPDARARLDAAAEAYKRRFRQQSVGVIVRQACVSF